MNARMPPVAITAWTTSSAVGAGRAALAAALAEQRSGLRPNDDTATPLDTWVGRIDTLAQQPLPAALAEWDCRATRLAWLALQADGFFDAVQVASARHGAARVGLLLGTSASTIGASELAYRQLDADGRFPAALRNPRLNTPHALCSFVQTALRLQGPAVTVSTACSSSARAFASAERWLRLGHVDAVVVAGVEALSASLLHGFRALGLVSAAPCRPFDPRRGGISIGEGAGFALLQRGEAALQLVGYGEANDAHHMSAPHPQGLGAEAALNDALQRAGCDAAALDFVNLHGTASERNDEVEAALLARRYGEHVHACATKGLTGHLMGAAGIVGAAICWLALDGTVLAGSAMTDSIDPVFGPTFGRQLRLQPAHGRATLAASHSFGFGGNNCVLVFGRSGA